MIAIVPALDCWQNTRNALSAAWESGRDVIEVVAAIFLRVLGAFFPVVIAVEILFTLYTRVSFYLRQKDLEGTIGRLEAENEPFRQQIRELKEEALKTEIAFDKIKFEAKMIEEERDEARKERDERIHGRAHLERQVRELETENHETKKVLETAIEEKEKITEEKKKDEQENERLLLGFEAIQKQLEHEKNEKALFEGLDHAIEQVKEDPQAGETLAELERVLPMFEEQEESYRQMFRDSMAAMKEDDPNRIPLQGFIDISEARCRHLSRVNDVIKFHETLKTPYLQLLQEKQA